jgi:predicted RNA-binding Zn-ribbon protein involved in translation (DUF1610 family)
MNFIDRILPPPHYMRRLQNQLCPECGHNPLNCDDERPYDHKYRITCQRCGWKGPLGYSGAEAVDLAAPEIDAATIVRAL